MKLHASNSIIVLVQAYQLFKARAYGADAVLLIAAVLPNNDLDYLAAAARKLGLQCLIEVRPVWRAIAHAKSRWHGPWHVTCFDAPSSLFVTIMVD